MSKEFPQPSNPPPVAGIAHYYMPTRKLAAFEFTTNPSKKVLLFIGGLTDGLCSVPYLYNLAPAAEKAGYSLIQIIFSSSYLGYGTGNLVRDTEEIGELVSYLRNGKNGSLPRDTVVLMGHSTGSQDVLQYVTKFLPTKTGQDAVDYNVDGIIMQAGASDRQAMEMEMGKETKAECDAYAKKMVAEGKEFDVLPKWMCDHFLGAPTTAYRWLSFSQYDGDDDFFSSDLSDEIHKKNFGKINRKNLIVFSANDEYVPAEVDRHAMVARWNTFIPEEFRNPLSRAVKGAIHNVGPGSEEGAEEELIDTVLKFLEGI